MNPRKTLLADCPTSVIRILLAGLLLLMLLGTTTKPIHHVPLSAGQNADIALWQGVVDRMRQGQPYYDAMEANLRAAKNYPMRPFWSFRLPILAPFMALFKTNLVPRIILTVLAGLMVLFWTRLLKAEGWLCATVGVLLLSFSVVCAVAPAATVMHDLWAGILIALSIALYGQNRPASLICGLIALSLRIHVVAFVGVMGIFALLERRWREALIWSVGLVAFGLYVSVHAWIVSRHLNEADLAASWMGVGAWGFVMATTTWTLPGLLDARILSGPLLPVSLLSLAVWPSPSGRRAAGTMLAYICAFMIMGNPGNDYWGLLYSPLWAVGVAYSPVMFRDLIKRARPCAFGKRVEGERRSVSDELF